MGRLYVVGTPIGNLDDVSKRALDILRQVDVILCEDTRHTAILLNRYDIRKELVSYHQHSKVRKLDEIVRMLEQGKSLAMVSDSGTPGISDPGNVLVRYVRDKLGDKVTISPTPGASALTALASVTGLPTHQFLFLGFLPHKGRTKVYKEIEEAERTVIFYESPYRIMRTLEDLKQRIPDRYAVIGRELTKQFETIYAGSIADAFEKLKAGEQRGEFVVAISSK